MRHRKHTFKIGKTTSHRRCMIANMLKSLIEHGCIETTFRKAKELKIHADKMVTLAKKDTLANRRRIISKLMISKNKLTSKEARQAKSGNISSYNTDRKVVKKLIDDISKRYSNRNGGYTRIIKMKNRTGDDAPICLIEYIK